VRTKIPETIQIRPWYDQTSEVDATIARSSLVLVDSYLVAPERLNTILDSHPRVAVLDDFRRLAYRRGTVIDWTVGAERFAYPNKHPQVRYLLGGRYCVLRQEFRNGPKRSFCDSPKSVLVTFGGSDLRSLTGPVLSMLQRRFPGLEKHVVVGPGFRDPSSLDARHEPFTFFHSNCDAALMQSLMAAADMAVCGGGQTLYEMASQGLPPVVVNLVENQADDIRGFVEAGFASAAGWWNSPDFIGILEAQLHELWPMAARARRAAAGESCVDRHGVQKLVEELLHDVNVETNKNPGWNPPAPAEQRTIIQNKQQIL
jgi:spore coat polysaccharide biosynthesis predicted glycosyltransferase SpsG